MFRSKLRNEYLRSKSEIDKQRYNKQRNYLVELLWLKKQKYYESLDINKINNNTFWKTTSSLFSNKSYSTNSRITLLENGEILREESKVADTFDTFFSNVIKELIIEKDNNLLTDIIEETDWVLKTIKKYKNHPSFVRIKSSCKYSFYTSQDSQVELCIMAPVLTECYNQKIKNLAFPNELKNADISPVYKKKTVMISQFIDQLAFCLFYQNHLNVFYMSK